MKTFSMAIEAMKYGHKIRRVDSTTVFFLSDDKLTVRERYICGTETDAIFTSSDVMHDDWVIADEEERKD